MHADGRQEGLWVLRAQCGDREALECLLRSVQPSLRRYLARLVEPADADDVLQETLLTIARKLSSLHQPALFRRWAFRIANRAGLHYLKKRRRWSDRVAADLCIDDVPAIGTDVDDWRIVNLLATQQISPACRAVLMLPFDEEMPLAQVAAVLELPLGTVKSRLAYGLAVLRGRLGERRQ
jgi:RNA polymerase sigma-70 factor, ECF subfamily